LQSVKVQILTRRTKAAPMKNPLRERVFHQPGRSDELFEFRHDLEEVAYQAVVGYLEDRRIFILVDRNDHLGILHARQVLDGTGDADRDIQLRRDDLAGLADLHVVGHEAGIDGSARSAYRGAKLVGQRVQVLEVVAVAHAAAAGNDDLGSGQFGAIRLGQLFADEGGDALVAGTGDLLDGSGTAFGIDRIEAGGTHGNDLDG